ncbi:MAG: 23S rRNA (adenine(2030)-N(6))-methyltransferase RlmJ [Hyphomicrobiaceae bacterium]|nr:23S rRNA (adenine(2030)-N(6))-methyltransferase RlmJ [Hyphomicrobiaceae bacterium]
MNYRHAFHAGNFADVLKHAVLARVIDYMKRKQAPFRVVDTHAGIGRYDLRSLEAGKTGEWQLGIGRLMGPGRVEISGPAHALLAPYLDAVSAENGGGPLQLYPGSPRLALRLMRACDRLVANELHPEDAAALKALLARERRARVTTLDAWVALRAFLPPKERRGIVLIDPPFEAPGELERIAAGLADGLARFATGTFMAWYPIKDFKEVERWQRTLAALATDKLISVDLLLRKPADKDRLNGCGLVILNAPYTLKDELAVLLPELVRVLSDDCHGYFKMTDRFTGTASQRPGSWQQKRD